MLFSPGYPGFLRGAGAGGPGEFVVTTSGGQVARYRPADGETDFLADGFDQLYGVAIGPGDGIVVAELGTGRVHRRLRSGSVEVLAIRPATIRSASRSTRRRRRWSPSRAPGRVVR